MSDSYNSFQGGVNYAEILAVCERNAGRSQIKCAYLNGFGSDLLLKERAGLDTLPLNPLVYEVMREDGYAIVSIHNSHSVIELRRQERSYDVVITVRSRESDALRAVFPRKTLRRNWQFYHPGRLDGSREEKLAKIHPARD